MDLQVFIRQNSQIHWSTVLDRSYFIIFIAMTSGNYLGLWEQPSSTNLERGINSSDFCCWTVLLRSCNNYIEWVLAWETPKVQSIVKVFIINLLLYPSYSESLFSCCCCYSDVQADGQQWNSEEDLDILPMLKWNQLEKKKGSLYQSSAKISRTEHQYWPTGVRHLLCLSLKKRSPKLL